MKHVHPHFLVDGQRQAMEFARAEYDSTLTGDARYVQGDLVKVVAGKVTKVATDTAADITGLCLAGQDWAQTGLPPSDPNHPAATHWFLARRVPLNLIPVDNFFVFTFQGDAADGSDYTLLSGDVDLIKANTKVELDFNATEKCLVVTKTTTAPHVKLLALWNGSTVGTVNAQVLVQILPERLK